MEETIIISQDRYDELIKTEARIQFLIAYVSREVYTTKDILYYLGMSEEGKDDENNG